MPGLTLYRESAPIHSDLCCDHCGRELDVGDRVLRHNHSGRIYCSWVCAHADYLERTEGSSPRPAA